MKVSPTHLVKTLLYSAGKDTVAVLIRGDHEANEVKIQRLLRVTDLELATPTVVEQVTGAPVGFAGPVGLQNVRIIADHAIKGLRNVVVGGNQAIRIISTRIGIATSRSSSLPISVMPAQAIRHREKTGHLKAAKGIEVGHVFMLGTKYSQNMKASFLDPHGKECLAVMGCYGIGVGRTAASAIEQNHDAKGIIWPFPIAPFHVHLLPLTQSAQTAQATTQLYDELQAAGLEVLWDDRDERAGVKFNDADLMGAPFQVVVGDKGLAEGVVEVKTRKDGVKLKLPPAQVAAHLTRTQAS